MKKIELKIEEIQQYFVNKIVNADYEIIAVDEYVCNILIDKKYKFSIWIGNDYRYLRLTEGHIPPCFMVLPEFDKTETEKIVNYLKGAIGNRVEEQRKAEKMAEYEKLKAELGIVNP